MHKGTFVKIAINKYDFFIFSERKQKNNILDGMCWLLLSKKMSVKP